MDSCSSLEWSNSGSAGIFCKHNCGFRGTPQNITPHEITCVKPDEAVICNLCIWTGRINEIINHMQNIHPDQLIVNSQDDDDNIIGFHNPLVMLLEYPKSYYCNEMYWLRLYQEGSNRHIMVQRIGHSGRRLDNTIPLSEFIVRSVRNNHVFVKGAVVDFSKDNSKSLMQKDFLVNNGSKIRSLEGGTYQIKLQPSEQISLPDCMLSALECMVCMETMRPPIRLCEEGHSMCGSCAERLSGCPKCRSGITNGRNYTLEEMVFKVPIPCLYHQNGCLSKVSLEFSADHALRCEFRPIFCMSYDKCEGKVNRNNLIKHLTKDHNLEVRVPGISYTTTLPDVIPNTGACLYSVFNQNFVLVVHYGSSNVMVGVHHITEEHSSGFFIEMKFSNIKNKHAVEIAIPCNPLPKQDIRLAYVSGFDSENKMTKKIFYEKICKSNKYNIIVNIFKK